METSQTWFNALAEENIYEAPDINTPESVAIQSQYSASPIIGRVGQLFRQAIDATDEMQQIVDEVLDPSTCAGVFLDSWGERVGVSRYLYIDPNEETGAPGRYERLDDEQYRFLIFYRAAVNVSSSDAYSTNQLLSKLTQTSVFVMDYMDMTVNSIVLIGSISDVTTQILKDFGLLNRPAGVKAGMLVIYPDIKIFGFQGSDLKPFGQGVFNSSRSIPLS